MSSERMFEYTPASATATMHAAPRFGHTDDFSALFTSNGDTEDYLKGLVFAGSFILAFFIVWCLALVVLKCLGKDRVGFLSGAAFTSTGARPFYIRIAFVNATLLFIVFTVLVVTQGLTNLHETVSIVGDSNEEVQSILSDARAISLSLESIGQSSLEVREEITNNLGNFCPAEPNIEALTGIDFDELAQEAITLLNELGDFIENDVLSMQNQIRSAQEASAVVGDTVDTIEANDWQSLVILIPFLTFATLMLIGVAIAWLGRTSKVYSCLLSYCILPLFICATVASFLCSAFVCLGAIGNADACSGGQEETPDQTVYSVLEGQGVDTSSPYYAVIQYYIEQCPSDSQDPFQFIRDYQGEIATAQETVANLSASLESVTVARLNLICGKDFGPFEGLLNTMVSNLQILSDNAQDTLSLLSCDRIVPLYVNSVYGATCTYSITGVTWTWSAFLVIAFMGMLMIMFRSSYLPNDTFDSKVVQSTLEEDFGYEVDRTYLPQETVPSSGESSPRRDDYEDEEVEEDGQSVSDMSSVYIYGTNYQVSFDENSQVGR